MIIGVGADLSDIRRIQASLDRFGDRFKTRPDGWDGPGGDFDPGTWFHGDAALFGGVEWQVRKCRGGATPTRAFAATAH